jgi:hypothetical protein
MTDIMQGRQQHIIAQRMKGMAYPMQLKVRNTIHNLAGSKVSKKKTGQYLTHRRNFFLVIPVQVWSVSRRRTPTKYPHISNNEPNSKETIQCHLEVVKQSINPANGR